MRSAQLLMVALAVGCAGPVPGDGRLVLVKLSSAISQHTVAPTDGKGGFLPEQTLEDFAVAGVRYWDVVGARLRVEGHLDDSDLTLPVSAVLDIVPDYGGIGSATDAEGWWSPDDGKIHIAVPLQFGGPPSAFSSLFAHEAGHALGLGHVDDSVQTYFYENVMDPLDIPTGLGPLDRKEFLLHW